jgi:hypothetical protein
LRSIHVRIIQRGPRALPQVAVDGHPYVIWNVREKLGGIAIREVKMKEDHKSAQLTAWERQIPRRANGPHALVLFYLAGLHLDGVQRR